MKKNVLVILMAAFVLGGCSSIKVVSDFDPTVDFTQYKTFEYYGWLEDSGKRLNDLDKRRIESAFGAEFEARGLEFVEDGGDLVVGLFIIAEQKTQTTAHTTSMGGGYGGYGGDIMATDPAGAGVEVTPQPLILNMTMWKELWYVIFTIKPQKN